ncbi:MAG: EAL domain-containing protein [Candidatus Wenzhouxiangella sp. M2_3B_020]
MPVDVYLEQAVGGGARPRRFGLNSYPCVIGRQPDCCVRVNTARISRHHAEIDQDGSGRLRIRDLGSTNGTFVNGDRIGEPTALMHGDVVHVGDQEFRLVVVSVEEPARQDERTQFGIGTLPNEFPVTVREFNELLEGQMVVGFRQVIADREGRVFGHELLGRGSHPTLDAGPGQLFALADALEVSVQLSEMMRRQAFAAAARSGMRGPLFFNTHPSELRDPQRLLGELASLQERFPDLELVFEVHETAVTDLEMMARIRKELGEIGVRLAYDDFGAGQARLQELVLVPPDFLKFDIALVRGVDNRGSSEHRFLSRLNGMIQDLGVRTLAEGIENEETASACAEIGIDLFQGFYFGHPEPID